MGAKGWWCNLPKMLQDQRWGMTAAACKWVLDLYNLKMPRNGKSFLIEFAWYMSTQTSGWQHDTWIEIACWTDMPEIRVGLHAEVELWTRWAEPQFNFARKHFQGPNGLPAHGMREVVKFQHEVARPLWDAAKRDAASLLPRAAAVTRSISDPELRDQMMLMLQKAVIEGAKEYYQMFSCHYETWMLPLWLCHGNYCASSARALAVTLGIPGCTPPQDNDMDRMFSKFFQDHQTAVIAHCRSWSLDATFHDEIKQMTNHTEHEASVARMKTLYPKYDQLLFDVVDALAFSDCICEIAFSHSKSTMRVNMSDTRHDNGMKWVHNVLYRLRKSRREKLEKMRTSKGLTRRIGVATTKTMPSMWIYAAEQLCKLQQRYASSVMERLKIVSSTKLRRAKKYRVRMLEKLKTDRSVEMLMQSNANRRRLTVEKKQELFEKSRDKNKNYQAFAESLEADLHAQTEDGKVMDAVARLISIKHWRSLSGGVTRFRLSMRQSFPMYTDMLDRLWQAKQRGEAPEGLPSTLWTRSGLIVRSVVTSPAGGVYSLHAYLEAMSTGNWDGISGTNVQSVLSACIGDPLRSSLFWMCWHSRSNRLIFRHASTATRVKISKDRKSKVNSTNRFQFISDSVGSDIVIKPLTINTGDVLPATVSSVGSKIKVRIFFDDFSETALLTDACYAPEIGDKVAIQVSNTSGGRDNLTVCISRTLLLSETYDCNKPVLVLTVEGVLGYFDDDGDGATGLFVSRPNAHDFLGFVSRFFNLAAWTINQGVVISSRVLLGHPLLFAGWGAVIPDPEDVVRDAGCTITGFSTHNTLFLVSDQHKDVTNSIVVSEYGKRHEISNRRARIDLELGQNSELRSVLQTASSTTDMGEFVQEYYHNE